MKVYTSKYVFYFSHVHEVFFIGPCVVGYYLQFIFIFLLTYLHFRETSLTLSDCFVYGMHVNSKYRESLEVNEDSVVKVIFTKAAIYIVIGVPSVYNSSASAMLSTKKERNAAHV